MRTDQQMKVRLPEELKQWVEMEAQRNCRSKTAEVVYALMAEKRRREQASTSKNKAPTR
ncbi:Arc family DNA-binding protein [Pseudomonas typographi]|uniref:Arc family DNA-binding protein n=1 Tax=Pseudomonas typographi TaxID=2715964 RepID=A0ABR7ZA06_9PSED|nr:Arc family DNA-binding protein [Pseudomonas typographi]MBD1602252.1 Arc family DNA-binding protein [Pseudomonas typographi]